MIVYVIKRNDGTYYKRCIDSIIMFEKEISSAEFYLDKSRVEEIVHFIIKRKHLYNILPEELNIVEVQLMETTELAEHDKKVRKEVCDEIIKFVDSNSKYTQEYGDIIYSMSLIRDLDKLIEIVEPNQTQGE